MKLWFFDIVHSGQEKAVDEEYYKLLSEEEADKELYGTGPYVEYGDYLKLKEQLRVQATPENPT